MLASYNPILVSRISYMFSELQRASHWSGLKVRLNRDWIHSLDCKGFLEGLLNEDGTRKFFNFYDSPPIPKSIREDLKPEIKKFKVYMIGKPGAGKTSTSNTLIGLKSDSKVYESLGLIVQTVYWPVCEAGKSGKTSLVCLELWDCGSRVSAQYPYLMQQCTKDASASLLLFSLTDRLSWDEMPSLMGRANELPTLQVMIGTRLDKLHESQVRVEELRQFERLYNLPLLLIGNKTLSKEQTGTKSSSRSPATAATPSAAEAAKQTLHDMSGFLTQLCEYLLNASQIIPLQAASIGSQI